MIKILLIDEYEERAQALTIALAACGYRNVVRGRADEYLPALTASVDPDVVLIDIDAPARDTLEQISTISKQSPRPVVLFTQQQDREVIERAIRSGVSAYVVDGIGSASVRPVIDAAVATFSKFQALREELEKTRTSLSERKIIDRAKGILMERRKIPENTAYRMMQRMAMDRKRRMADVAQDVIAMVGILEEGK